MKRGETSFKQTCSQKLQLLHTFHCIRQQLPHTPHSHTNVCIFDDFLKKISRLIFNVFQSSWANYLANWEKPKLIRNCSKKSSAFSCPQISSSWTFVFCIFSFFEGRIAKGEDAVLTKERPHLLAVTSGTTGPGCMIPRIPSQSLFFVGRAAIFNVMYTVYPKVHLNSVEELFLSQMNCFLPNQINHAGC